MYSFTNQFSGPLLRQRIGMMNRHRSGWGRYVLWSIVVSAGVLACRHKSGVGDFGAGQASRIKALPATNPTRGRVVELEDDGSWYRHLALYRGRSDRLPVQTSDPYVVQIKNNRLVIGEDYQYETDLYINGKAAPVESLSRVAPEFTDELFVLHQWENQPDRNTQAKPYQVLVQTSPKLVPISPKRKHLFTLLQAAALSKHPRGESYMFTMNSLLEATFFRNKNALVERTKNEHLKLYDEFRNDVDVFINELPATTADVETVHVREVARLYTKERPYTDWFRAGNPRHRFELHIQTTPKRAKRDSSYYVFSPFYTGDF